MQKLDQGPSRQEEADLDTSYLLDDYESGNEASPMVLDKKHSSTGGVSMKTFGLLNRYVRHFHILKRFSS